jgi:gluconate 2-dehydrogenase gamma chain
MAEQGPKEKQFSRRDFLKTTGVATGGIIGGSLLGGLVGFKMDDGSAPSEEASTEEASDQEDSGSEQEDPGWMFFTKEHDFDTISAAMERIFPEDDLGPGAIGLGAPYFLDMQLAGDYGSNAKEYMQGPFREGLPTQGYQARMTRAEYFTLAIERLNAIANDEFDDDFKNLEPEQMDEIIESFESGDADMGIGAVGGTSDHFFNLLKQATIEGCYCDPMYRGNRDMEGWRMKKFPGHQHAYINEISEDGFQEIDPLPLYGGGGH